MLRYPGTLPGPGATLQDQQAGIMKRITVAANAYNAMKAWNELGLAGIRKRCPHYEGIVQDIFQMRVEADGRTG